VAPARAVVSVPQATTAPDRADRRADLVAIFAAGEEVRLSFDAAAVPVVPPGMRRSWVLDVAGWCKDMDLLTQDGATLDPLPMRDGSPARTAPAARDALHRRFNTRWAGGQ